jgi:hypothetical protein
MRRPVNLVSLAGFVSLAACATGTADRARDVAANRLRCPAGEVTMSNAGASDGALFVASGCGERTLCEYVRSSRLSDERVGARVAVRCVSLEKPDTADVR